MTRTLVIGAVLSAVWCAAFAAGRASGAVLPWLGGAALLVLLVFGPASLKQLTARPRDFIIGIAFGLVSLAGTYGLYPVVTSLVPRVRGDAAELYALVPAQGGALVVVLLVVVAEEVLWRGALLGAFSEQRGAVAVGASTLLYAVAQAGSGALALGIAAVVLGVYWAIEARWTASLTAPLISHAIWTVTVFGIHPLGTLQP